MKQQFIISFILATVFGAALAIKHLYFPVLSGHNAYYFLSIFWICGLLLPFLIIHMIWQLISGGQKPKLMNEPIVWPNRRKSYRIIYPDFLRPTLVIEHADNQEKRLLEYPVVDLSQEGICFTDDGSLGSAELLQGYVRFENGDKLAISGKLLRRKASQISVQLTHSIDWSIILNEQRRLMAFLRPQK